MVTIQTTKWHLPPKAKVFEALSAIADSRVNMLAAEKAEVSSSTGGKTYIVKWSPDGKHFTTNDNASYWQGYLGYPIIAVLLLSERIPYNKQLIQALAGIPWKAINKQHKNNYDKAVTAVLQSLQEKGTNTGPIVEMVDNIFEQLPNLDLENMAGRHLRPPLD
jgi:hypothetical protein